jgi:CRISPR-associated protein Cmr4
LLAGPRIQERKESKVFTERAVVWAYCLTPTHMGAGQGLGYVDAPVARERATNYPILPASGLKGALRHAIEGELAMGGIAQLAWEDVDVLFGKVKDGDVAAAAGAMSLGDGSLVAYPVRSIERAFFWVTSPSALARVRRIMVLGGEEPDWEVPTVDEGEALRPLGVRGGELVLDQYVFSQREDLSVGRIATRIARGVGAEPLEALVGDWARLDKDLVVVSDESFGFFMESLVPVDPHVRIDPETRTAMEGLLFFVEQVPAEAIFIAPLLMAPRIGKDQGARHEAKEHSASARLGRLVSAVHEGFGGLLQIGAKASAGSGLVGIRIELSGSERRG